MADTETEWESAKTVHTPLQFAAFDGNIKLVALLLSHGASVGFSFDDDPALYHAVCARNEEAIRALLSEKHRPRW